MKMSKQYLMLKNKKALLNLAGLGIKKLVKVGL
jgi:hypothetical protein